MGRLQRRRRTHDLYNSRWMLLLNLNGCPWTHEWISLVILVWKCCRLLQTIISNFTRINSKIPRRMCLNLLPVAHGSFPTAIRKREYFPSEKMIYVLHSISSMACCNSNAFWSFGATVNGVLTSSTHVMRDEVEELFECEGKLNIDVLSSLCQWSRTELDVQKYFHNLINVYFLPNRIK